MKRPYDVITADCAKDGVFSVERKPKTGQRALSTCGQDNSSWKQVVCPKCRMWAPVKSVEEVR